MEIHRCLREILRKPELPCAVERNHPRLLTVTGKSLRLVIEGIGCGTGRQAVDAVYIMVEPRSLVKVLGQGCGSASKP